MGARHGKPSKKKSRKSNSKDVYNNKKHLPVIDQWDDLNPPPTPERFRNGVVRDQWDDLNPPPTPERFRNGVVRDKITPPGSSVGTQAVETLDPNSPPRTPQNRLLAVPSTSSILFSTPPSTPSRTRSILRQNSSLTNLCYPLRTKVIAIYSYESLQEDEISFKKGDVMETSKDSENSDWYVVKHMETGAEGYIPGNYVIVGSNSVKTQDWWYPLERGDAERTLLNPEITKGTFLIRERKDASFPYALSVKDYSVSGEDFSVRHYKIQTMGNRGYCIDGQHLHVFSNIQQLVEFYSNSLNTGLCCRLTTACPKKKPLVPFRDMEVSRNQINLLKKVGDGFFGEVWIGRMNNKEDVAVKMMKQGKMDPQNFIKEAKVLNKLRHPKLVHLRGVCTRTRPIMIITELMVRGDLRKYLLGDAGKRVKLLHLVDIAGQIASGMSFLEKCNYIHRDLRAANVLVGENHTVKIADFGLARLVANDDDIYYMSNQSKVPIKWTAPESLFYHEFSSKSDVWSYGVLLFEIFTYGQTPYHGLNTTEIAKFLKNGYRMSKPAGKNFPEDVYAIMMRCWKQNPDNRPTFSYLQSVFDDFIVSSERKYKDMTSL